MLANILVQLNQAEPKSVRYLWGLLLESMASDLGSNSLTAEINLTKRLGRTWYKYKNLKTEKIWEVQAYCDKRGEILHKKGKEGMDKFCKDYEQYFEVKEYTEQLNLAKTFKEQLEEEGFNVKLSFDEAYETKTHPDEPREIYLTIEVRT